MADEQSIVIPDIIADPSSFDANAAFWLKAAQAAIRRHCGWHVTPNCELAGVANTRGGKVLRLPARNVTSLDELTDRRGRSLMPGVAYDPATGLVERIDGQAFPEGVAAVRYRIHAGYNQCDDVRSVLISAAQRASLAAGPGLVASQSTNGSTVTYANLVTLMDDEKAKLNPYRLEALP